MHSNLKSSTKTFPTLSPLNILIKISGKHSSGALKFQSGAMSYSVLIIFLWSSRYREKLRFTTSLAIDSPISSTLGRHSFTATVTPSNSPLRYVSCLFITLIWIGLLIHRIVLVGKLTILTFSFLFIVKLYVSLVKSPPLSTSEIQKRTYNRIMLQLARSIQTKFHHILDIILSNSITFYRHDLKTIIVL